MRYIQKRVSFTAAAAVIISFSINVAAQEENLRHTPTDHKRLVSSLAFSPDSKTLVSGSYDRTLILRDVESGEVKKTLKGHKDFVRSVAFSPDGRTIASGADDEMIILWDAQSGEVKRRLKIPGPGYRNSPQPLSVLSLAFSRNGKMIATGNIEGKVVLWDVETGKLLRSFVGHSDGVRSIVFSPDDQTLATGSVDDTIILWDVQTAKRRLKLKSKESHARTLSFSSDGETLTCGCALVARTAYDSSSRVTGSSSVDLIIRQRVYSWQEIGGEVKMWNVQTGEILLTMRTSQAVVRSIICSPGCKLAGNKIDDHSVLLWNAQSGKLEMNLGGHKRQITAVTFSPDGRFVASASADKTVKLWDVSDSKTPR